MSDVNAEIGQTLDAHVVVVRYTLFAVVAGLANLASQALVLNIAPSLPLVFSILVGTGVGFLAKYALDKHWIFFDGYADQRTELRKITVYGLFSVGTTLLFWASELAAWQLWHTDVAKYCGAVAGLTLGNWIKYQLDKRYVFRKAYP